MHDPVAPGTLQFAASSDRRLADRPPQCLRCGYNLEHLTALRCPECGLPFNPQAPHTFTRAPAYVWWLYWLPGLLTAIVLGGAICAWFLSQRFIGWGLTLGAPVAIGALLGYGTRPNITTGVLLTIASVIFVVSLMFTLQMTGPLCSFVLAVLFMFPAMVGVWMGKLVRSVMKATSFSQRWHLPVVLFLLVPMLLHVCERTAHLSHRPETVSTTRDLAVPLVSAWHADLFAGGPAPSRTPMMRLGLPQPQHVDGTTDVGDVKTATFSVGAVAVRVTGREEYRRLAFTFIGQAEVEDRAVRLLDGAFDYQPIDDAATRVTLSTRYQPLMTPRWYWRTFEVMSGHSMHGHLLDELERAARLEAQETAPDGKTPR